MSILRTVRALVSCAFTVVYKVFGPTVVNCWSSTILTWLVTEITAMAVEGRNIIELIEIQAALVVADGQLGLS